MEYPYLVSVLLPTRARPELMLQSITSIIEKARHPEKVQILLKIDNDDMESYVDYYSEIEKITPHYKVIYSPRGLGYGDLHTHVNDLCAIADGEYLFLWNDDAELLTVEWDKIMEEHSQGLHGTPIAVIQIDDTAGWKFGFPFVHREIYRAIGHFSLNAHNDTWMHMVAEAAGVERMEWRILTNHYRYDLSADSKMEDETYTDVWNKQQGGYHQTHQLLMTPEQIELRRQDSLKIRNLLDRM